METTDAYTTPGATAVGQEDKFRRTTDPHLVACLAKGDAQSCADDLLAEAPIDISWAEIEVLCNAYSGKEGREFDLVRDGLCLGSADLWKEEYAAHRLCYFASLIGEQKVEEIIEESAIRPYDSRKPKRDRGIALARLAVFRQCRLQRPTSISPSDADTETRGREPKMVTVNVTRRELKTLCRDYVRDYTIGWRFYLSTGHAGGSDRARDMYTIARTSEFAKHLGNSVVRSIHLRQHGVTPSPVGTFVVYDEEEVT